MRAGEYEAIYGNMPQAIYGNMPRVGLAKVAEDLPLDAASTAARRLGIRPEDETPVAGY